MSTALAWGVLIIAGLLEIVWAVGLKYTQGFTKLTPSILTITAMAISMLLLSLALRVLPIGTGYAVWTGIGAAGTAVIGMILFGDAVNVTRCIALSLIVMGIILLKFGT